LVLKRGGNGGGKGKPSEPVENVPARSGMTFAKSLSFWGADRKGRAGNVERRVNHADCKMAGRQAKWFGGGRSGSGTGSGASDPISGAWKGRSLKDAG